VSPHSAILPCVNGARGCYAFAAGIRPPEAFDQLSVPFAPTIARLLGIL
jgi:hypothetical protein